MAIVPDMDPDLIRVWGLIAELSEQLNANRAATAALQAQAGMLKTQALHSGTGFALRRFNLHVTKEAYESELERMNATMMQENQSLFHDNKQLSVLLREYEQTLESVMSKFRSYAHDSQQHELGLTRTYERTLVQRETGNLAQELSGDTSLSVALSRISQLLRMALRAQGGEDIDPLEADGTGSDGAAPDDLGYLHLDTDVQDWALERECELVRLEKENEELKRMLGIGQEPQDSRLPQRADSLGAIEGRSSISSSPFRARGAFRRSLSQRGGRGGSGPGGPSFGLYRQPQSWSVL